MWIGIIGGEIVEKHEISMEEPFGRDGIKGKEVEKSRVREERRK